MYQEKCGYMALCLICNQCAMHCPGHMGMYMPPQVHGGAGKCQAALTNKELAGRKPHVRTAALKKHDILILDAGEAEEHGRRPGDLDRERDLCTWTHVGTPFSWPRR
jgi:hypothetical protein